MGIGTFIYNICLGPLTLFFEMVFHTADKLVGNHGVAIIILSLVINLLILPLYNRADSLQRQQRELEKKLQPGIDHIKKTFTGDERFMMIQTYYRQYNYSPLSSLKGATSLLLQIPFFICAYRMLSSLSILNGVSFGLINDLGKPDGILILGSISINILPILMTIINVVSGTVYTKDLSRKDRIRIYTLALIFLVLLYNSPAGLTFYWTLNNLFSLCKNIISSIIHKKNRLAKTAREETKAINTTFKPYLLSGIYASIFTGLFIPAYFLSSSPIECLDYIAFDNPMKYVLYSCSLAVGTFVVWASIIYYFVSPKAKRILSMIYPGLVAYFTINCFNYRGGLYNFSINMASTPDSGPVFDSVTFYTNAFILLLCVAFSIYLFVRMRFALYTLLTIGIVSMGLIGMYVTNNGNTIYNNTVLKRNDEPIRISLSSTEPNVVVIMLDRAAGYQMENIMKLYPDIRSEFDGFTYYPNTLSFGICTNIASPALFGGYEYIPEVSNIRNDVSLEQKHNESLLVMPTLFSENGYDVTVIDPPYAGYQEYPDLTIYDDLSNTKAYVAQGVLNSYGEVMENQINAIKERNIFCYSLLCIAPPLLSDFIYDSGNYNQAEPSIYAVQTASSPTEINGMDYNTARAYEVLDSLPDITEVSSDSNSNFVLLQNSLTHGESFLQEPNMTLSLNTINSQDLSGELVGDSMTERMHLQVNVAALRLLGEWFNYLREMDCYDNTRIIITSDHGFITSIPEYDISPNENLGRFMPLLMVKDFGSTGFYTSEERMTNADTPYLAMLNIIDNPINPFTGNSISRRWLQHDTLNLSNSEARDILRENGTTFTDSDWFSVNGDIRDPDNWIHYNSYNEILNSQ